MEPVAVIQVKKNGEQFVYRVMPFNDQKIREQMEVLAAEHGLGKEHKYKFLCNDFGYAYGWKKDADGKPVKGNGPGYVDVWFDWFFVDRHEIEVRKGE